MRVSKKYKGPQKGRQQSRTVDIAVREVDKESRKVTLSFSSEQSVSRWYGQEILSHDDGCVDLKRLNEIGVLLFNHKRDSVIGKIEKAWLGDDLRCYAEVIFDDDEESERIFKKVESGTLKGVSVGYSVDVWEEVLAGKKSSNGRYTGPAYIATRWSPLEISIVSVPADDSVGVGRELEDQETDPAGGRSENTNKNEREGEDEDMTGAFRRNRTPNFAPDNGLAGSGAPEGQERGLQTPPDLEAERKAAAIQERQRISEITDLCRSFDIDERAYTQTDMTVDQVRASVLKKLQEERTAVPGVHAGEGVTKDETDKIRAAASDSILLRAGRIIEKPADGARDMRGMSLRDLAIDCAIRAGVPNAHRLDDDQLFRSVLTPDSQFASIMSDSVNKSMSGAYNAASTTYQLWTGKGSTRDFKTATHYQISEAGDLEKMTQSGEFKNDEVQDLGVTKAIATFGKSFGFTRQALINDDLGVLTKIPEKYVRSAKRGINKLVYSMIGNNPTIYDGVALFHANHGNLGSAAVISTPALDSGRGSMRVQKNLRGKETLNIAPRYLLVPAAKETTAQQFVASTADPNALNSGTANVFRNLVPIADAELDAYSTISWYLAASPADVDTIEVTYLNGDEMPKLENQVGFDFLGIKWRIYIDYGVTVLDYKGLYKNPGQ